MQWHLNIFKFGLSVQILFYLTRPSHNINTYLKIHINTRHSPSFSVCTVFWVGLHGLVISWAATDRQTTQHKPIPAARFLLTKQNEDRQVCACVANQCCQAETSNLKKNRPIFNNSWLPSWPGYNSSAMSSCLIGFWWGSSIIKTHLRGQYSNISGQERAETTNSVCWQCTEMTIKQINEWIHDCENGVA